MSSPLQRLRLIEAGSLIVAPALMSVGDLMHPAESWNSAAQVAIIAAAAGRWYLAHLLLFVGILFFVPGILALSRMVALHRPALGYACRVLLLASVGALAAVFACEMLLGSFTAADQRAAVALVETFNSRVLVALLPGLLAFFVGVGLFVAPLASNAGPLRWPALCLGLGALLILGEIITAQVILSQIGNVLILIAGSAIAKILWSEGPVPVAGVAA
jgi:hypothetical protein